MGKPTKSNKIKKQAMIVAMANKLGVISHACEEVGINRTTYYEWMEKDEDFRDKINALNELVLDEIEAEALRRMKTSDAVLIFLMKTKLRGRGYTERIEHEHVGQVEHLHDHEHTITDRKVIKIAEVWDDFDEETKEMLTEIGLTKAKKRGKLKQ